MRKFIITFFIGLTLGCSETTLIPDSDQLGLDYFPLETGLFRIYDVNEINFSVLGSDTSIYQLKESVVDSFFNAEESFTYIIHREKRADILEPWVLDSVWTARKTNSIAIMTENNLSIVKLVFPIEHGIQWDGYRLSNKNEKLFSYDLNVSDTTLAETQLTELVKVIQSDIPENLINRDERHEIYSKGIGLVIKSSVVLEFCQQNCPESKTIESGRKFEATLIEYGKE